jgi:hypothetical protein
VSRIVWLAEIDLRRMTEREKEIESEGVGKTI